MRVSDVVARPVLSRILLPSAYYTRGLLNNCDHICQQTVNFTVGCDSSAAWQTCCNTVFWRDGSGGMYLWRHTSEHQQVTDFVIAFLNKAEIGRNGYCSRDFNLQSKKVFGLFIPSTGLFLFVTVEVTIQPWLKKRTVGSPVSPHHIIGYHERAAVLFIVGYAGNTNNSRISLLFLFCVAKSHLYAFKWLHTSLLEVLGPVYMGPPPPYEQALRAQRIYAKITWYLSPDNWTYNWLYDVSKIENQSQSLSLLIRHRDSDSFLYGILLAATLCL